MIAALVAGTPRSKTLFCTMDERAAAYMALGYVKA